MSKDIQIAYLEAIDKIADLEAKLAESEADKKALICDYESRMTKEQELMSWLEHNNEELKQQLAEKEKERHEEWKTGKEWKWEWQKVNQKLEKAEQNKISFAVTELEKVKVLIHNAVNIDRPEYDLVGLYDAVSNQIKQLKKNTHKE